jgi:hypothetical protein
MSRMKDGNTEAPLCDGCRRIPITHLALDIDEPIEGWESFFEESGVMIMDDAVGRPSIARHVLADLLDEQREREARLAEEAAARQAPVVTPGGIPAREGMSAYEVMMGAGGMSPQEEFGRIPKPTFLADALEAGQRHQEELERAIAQRKDAK